MLTALLARAALLSGLLLALAGTAHSHAVVLETVPADGDVLAHAPDRITIRFDEPVFVIATTLRNAEGRDITPPHAASVVEGTLAIALPPAPAPGTYVASYRVVSLDGHPIGGSIVFSVGEASGRSSVADAAADDRAWRIGMAVTRAMLDACILGGAGGVLFLLLVAKTGGTARTTARIAGRVALAGCLAAIVSVGVHGGLLTGAPASALASPETWWTGFSSRFGRTATAAFLGFALIAGGLIVERLRPGRSARGRALAVAGASVALVSFGLSGHVVTAGPRWLTAPLLIAHAAAVAFWVGSLLPLRSAVSRQEPGPVIRRFSALAIGAVLLLVAAGSGIAILQVGSVSGLFTTDYGWTLLTKLALVSGLLALAAINKLHLTPALERGDAGAATRFRGTIAAELALVAAILAATAMLGTTPPPRVLQGDGMSVADQHAANHHAQGPVVRIETAGRTATLRLASPRSGANSVKITLTDRAGKALEASEVTFAAANPEAGVEPIRRAAARIAAGEWQVPDLLLTPAGAWSIRAEALVSDFEKPIFEGTIELH